MYVIFFPNLFLSHLCSSVSYVLYSALSFVIKQLVARGVKAAVGAAPAQTPDSTPQEAASKATPSSRPTTPAISMTAALKDVGAVSHHHTSSFICQNSQNISWLLVFFCCCWQISSGQSSPMKEDSLKAETSGVQVGNV